MTAVVAIDLHVLFFVLFCVISCHYWLLFICAAAAAAAATTRYFGDR